jgi:predicted MFS family arabinose efflux permease
MQRALIVASLIAFSTALFTRSVDPVVPQIAGDFGLPSATVALLATAFALPFALVQPLLGPVGDFFGKTRLMIAAMVILVIVTTIGAFATSFTALVITRVIAGMAAGGIFPAAMAFVSDTVSYERRQVALGRFLAAALTGNLTGAWAGGIVGDLVGWRGVLLAVAVSGLLAIALGLWGFRHIRHEQSERFSLGFALASYRIVFSNPKAKLCYFLVFIEGFVIFGLFPFVAILLQQTGEYRASIAGLIIAGFALGGALYGMTVSMLLRVFGTRGLMIWGGLIAGSMLLLATLLISWQVEFITFFVMGLGFYMMHNTFQLASSELAPSARGSALALHGSSFFLGHAAGPVYYYWGLTLLGIGWTLTIAAALLAITGFAGAYFLFPKPRTV